MTLKKTILFVGALWEGSTALQRMHALHELGHHVVSLDYATPEVKLLENRLYNRIIGKLYRMGIHNCRCSDLAGINQQIIDCLKTNNFDVVFFDKCLTINIEIFKYIRNNQPRCLIIGYSLDDMYARHNQSRQFLDTLSQYDVFFTTKSYGVGELQSLGCKDVQFIGNAYDHHTHRLLPMADDDRLALGGKVGFIGAWEAERARSMYHLAQAGIEVRVWGEGWNRCRQKHANLRLEYRPIWAADYARGINSFDINLCFLRKLNRDLQTTRSIEIPACGGFMLAERTTEHEELFVEGVEAEFFSSDEELLRKTKYYLDNPSKRAQIASAGRARCLKSGYSYVDRMKQILSYAGNIRKFTT